MSVYVGMDVHRKRSQVAIVDQAGAVQRNRNLPNDPAELRFFLELWRFPLQGLVVPEQARQLPGSRCLRLRSFHGQQATFKSA